MNKKLLAGLTTGMLIINVVPAMASSFTTTLTDNLGPLDGGVLSYSVPSPGNSLPGAANLAFDLLGYLSIDGANCCTDTFQLTINNQLIFSGGFNMGGEAGGFNFINFIDPGVNIVSSTSFGGFAGGLTQFSVFHTLLAGNNTYKFDYGSMEGLGNEGWGLRSATISADISGIPVPEPYTILLFIIGVAGLVASRIDRAKSIN
jgi:hypothetical protein